MNLRTLFGLGDAPREPDRTDLELTQKNKPDAPLPATADAARLARIERAADALLRELCHLDPATFGRGDQRLPSDVAELAGQNRRLEAIKAYHEQTGTDLLTAKNAVDAYIHARADPTETLARIETKLTTVLQDLDLASLPQKPAASGDTMNAEVAAFARAGRMIDAIKRYREVYGGGLKESKDAVEAWKRDNL